MAPASRSSDWPPCCHHVAGSWQAVRVCMWGGLLCHSYSGRALTQPAWPSSPGFAGKVPGAAPRASRMGKMLRAPYIMTRLTGAHVSAETAHAANPGLPISLMLVIAYNENSTVCSSMDYNIVKRINKP